MKKIKNKIKEEGYEAWRRGIEAKSTLKWYKGKLEIRKEDMYDGDWGGKLLFKARSGSLEVNGKNRERDKQGCKLCGEEKETIDHLIIECEKFDEERQALDSAVAGVLGREEWERRKEEEDRGMKTVLGYTENSDSDRQIVNHTKNFLKKCWTIIRKQMQ